ncbi:radical SAM protein [Pseudodesulfovibrio sp.]|nr:radical SAM protein [Pseudodesulfovibrio sp.]
MTKEIHRLDALPKGCIIGIYGCGKRGTVLHSILQQERPDIRVACFIDSFKSGSFLGLDTIQVDNVEKIDSLCEHILIASTFAQEILHALPPELKEKTHIPLHGFFQWYGHRSGDTAAYSTIHIEANTNCNMRCTFCVSTFLRSFESDKQLTMETMRDIIQHISSARIARTVSILGERGEPLVYRHLDESLDFIKKQGLGTSMITNGLLLDHTVFQRLEGRLDSLVISLHNLSDTSFRIRGIKSSYDAYLKGISRFLRAHSETQSNMTVVVKVMLAFPDWPASQMYDVAAILDDTRNLQTVFPNFARKLNQELNTDHMQLSISPEDLNWTRERMAKGQHITEFPMGNNVTFAFVPIQSSMYSDLRHIDPALYNKFNLVFPGDRPCSLGDPAIDIDGNVSLCCIHDAEIRLGNIYDDHASLHDMVTGEKAESMMRDFSLDQLPYKVCKLCRANYSIKE